MKPFTNVATFPPLVSYRYEPLAFVDLDLSAPDLNLSDIRNPDGRYT